MGPAVTNHAFNSNRPTNSAVHSIPVFISQRFLPQKSMAHRPGHIVNPNNLRSLRHVPSCPNPEATPAPIPPIPLTHCNPDSFLARKGLGILHYNIRSLCKREKLDHVKLLLSQTDPDVLILTESWLNRTIPDSDIALNEYSIYRTDRVSRGGGVAIYVKARFSITVLKSVSIAKHFDFIALKLDLGKSFSITVIGIYRPPAAPPDSLNLLTDLLSSFLNTECLISGDFNWNWLTDASHCFKNACVDLGLTQLISEPTRPNLKYPHKSTLLDLILTNRPEKYTSSGVFPLGVSDHCPVACIRNDKLKRIAPKILIRRNLKVFNAEAFLRDLAYSDLSNIFHISDPELALDFFINRFNSLVNKHAPYKKIRVKNRSNKWFTNELSALHISRNKAWALARRSGDPSHWLAFRQLRNKCSASVGKAKAKFYIDSLDNNSTPSNPKKFWKIINSTRKQNSNPLPTHLNLGNSVLTNENEICTAFNNHFATAGLLFDNLFTNTTVAAENLPPSSGSSLSAPESHFSLAPFNTNEVFIALSAIDSKKSVGEDCLDPFFLKVSAPLIADLISYIFNLSISSGKIPPVWKIAHVTPLHKGNDKKDPDNYRPISKLSCLAKILESLVNNQLKVFLNHSSILSPHQSGFRAKHSTTTATSLVLNDIVSALDNKLVCAALFIDLSKAFDTVDHTLLLNYLCQIGFDPTACMWFKNYLSERHQCVKVGSTKSELVHITKGVPQGSILGPILFSLYINKVVNTLETCNAHLYADDTILYCFSDTVESSLLLLQHAFDTFQKSLLDLRLVLNAEKTKYMLFTKRTLIGNYPQLCASDGTIIERVPHYKYLGIWLDDKLTFRTHIEVLTKKLRMKLGFFYRNRSCFPWHTRKRLIEALFLSALDYGDIIYRNAPNTALKSLDSVYHAALRFITGDSYLTHHCILYNKVGWPSLATRRDQHWFLFIYKALIGSSPSYLTSLLNWKSTPYGTRSQTLMLLEIPQASTDLGKSAFKYCAPHTWNTLQASLKYSSLVPLGRFQSDLSILISLNCTCFN